MPTKANAISKVQPRLPALRSEEKPPEPRQVQNVAELLREYVSAGGNLAAVSMVKGAPRYIDDATRDFGDDLYERMLKDPAVFAGIEVLKRHALADGFSLKEPVAAPDEKKGTEQEKATFAHAVEIKDFCQAVIDDLEEPMLEFLDEMMDALGLGNRVAELNFEYRTMLGSTKVVIKNIKPKLRRSTAFVVDAFNNVIAIMGVRPGQSSVQTLSTFDPNVNSDLIFPREKFAILTFKKRNSDPRGSSLLRAAYNPWYIKQQAWPELLKYLVQFGSMSLLAITGEGAQAEVKRDAAGQPINDTDGYPIEQTPQQAAVQTLMDFRNGSVAAFPFGTTVEKIGGEPFRDSPFSDGIAFLDKQIMLAITGGVRSMLEAEHGSRADSQTAQDILGMAVASIKNWLSTMVRRDILVPLVKLNFGDEDARLYTPQVVLSSGPHEDFAANADAVSRLYASGFIAGDQLPGIDAKLGLPARDMDLWMADKAAEQAAKEEASLMRSKLFAPAQQPQVKNGEQPKAQ